VLAARWIGLGVIEAQHFALDTASLSILGFKPDHPDVPVIVRWNMLPAIRSDLNRAASM
jgi:broad specificity phosphatase PhoE